MMIEVIFLIISLSNHNSKFYWNIIIYLMKSNLEKKYVSSIKNKIWKISSNKIISELLKLSIKKLNSMIWLIYGTFEMMKTP